MKTIRRGEWRLRKWNEMRKRNPVKFYSLITLAVLLIITAIYLCVGTAGTLKWPEIDLSGWEKGAATSAEASLEVKTESSAADETGDLEGRKEEDGRQEETESLPDSGEPQESSAGDEQDNNAFTGTTAAPSAKAGETGSAGTSAKMGGSSSAGTSAKAGGSSSAGTSAKTGGSSSAGTSAKTGETGSAGTSAKTGGSGSAGTSAKTGGSGSAGTSAKTGGSGSTGTSAKTGGSAGTTAGGTGGGGKSGTAKKGTGDGGIYVPGSSAGKRQYRVSDYAPGDQIGDDAIYALGKDPFFNQTKINDKMFERIYGKSYKEDCIIPREDLRYISVLYYDFDGNRQMGEIISNKAISQDLLEIFKELYENKYPIEKICLVDDYDADDDRSSSDNNSSCFNYRTVAGKSSLSLHARGLAIDINPVYNPYISLDGAGNITECLPSKGSAYTDRTQQFSYKIDTEDLCYRLFTERGFTWGGSWTSEKDFMHFSKSTVPET